MKIIRLQNALLYGLFFSVNFEVWDPLNTGGYFSLSKFFGILYFLTILPHLNKFISIPNRVKIPVIYIIIFYLLLLLINIFHLGYYSNDAFSTSILLNVCFFVFIVNHERIFPGVIEKSFIWFLYGALISTAAFYVGVGVEVTIDGRVSLFGDDENLIGFRMLIALLVLTHYVTKNSRNLSKPFILIVGLAYFPLTALLLSTGSRTSVISLILCGCVFIILYKTNNIITKISSIILFLLSASFILNLILQSEVVGPRLMLSLKERSLAGRDDIWGNILPLVEENFLFGVGQTGYIDFSHRIFGQYASPHNVILEVLSYTGIIGLFLYLAFIITSFLYSFNYYLKSGELIPLIFAIPILGLLLGGQLLVIKLGWFIFAYSATRNYYNSK